MHCGLLGRFLLLLPQVVEVASYLECLPLHLQGPLSKIREGGVIECQHTSVGPLSDISIRVYPKPLLIYSDSSLKSNSFEGAIDETVWEPSVD